MSVDEEVSCKQAYDLLFSYLEGELAPATTQSLEAHFALCPPCQEFLASYRKTPSITRAALDAEVPGEVTDKLMDFLRARIGGR